MAIQLHHVNWNQAHHHQFCMLAPSLLEKYCLGTTHVAKLTVFLGWLQSMDVFNLKWEDITIIRPSEGLAHNFPVGAGSILLGFLPYTKNS